MPENVASFVTETAATPGQGPISWWSWRPGIRPTKALIIGGVITAMACALLVLGIMGIVFTLRDSTSSPVQVQGIVIHHEINALDRQEHLFIRIHTPGFPTEISPGVTPAAFHDLQDGSAVVLEYSPHLHVLSALQKGTQYYALPGTNIGSMFTGALALCVIGLLLFPYPLLLLWWGWRDSRGKQRLTIQGEVIALRTATQTKVQRPGILPRTVHSWYGVALHTEGTGGRPFTFSVKENMYKRLQEGTQIRLTCSPCLHYVYSLEAVHEPE